MPQEVIIRPSPDFLKHASLRSHRGVVRMHWDVHPCTFHMLYSCDHFAYLFGHAGGGSWKLTLDL